MRTLKIINVLVEDGDEYSDHTWNIGEEYGAGKFATFFQATNHSDATNNWVEFRINNTETFYLVSGQTIVLEDFSIHRIECQNTHSGSEDHQLEIILGV